MKQNRKKRNIIILFFVIVMFSLTIGYAALSASLSIASTTQIKGSVWDIKIDPESLKVVSKNGNVKEASAPVISGTNLTLSTSMQLPGDEIVYQYDIVNNGTINATLDAQASAETFHYNDPSGFTYIEFWVSDQTGSDSKSDDKFNILAGQRITYNIKMKLSDFTDQALSQEERNYIFNGSLIFVQSE